VTRSLPGLLSSAFASYEPVLDLTNVGEHRVAVGVRVAF